jgi:hypothetical protein
VQFISNLVNQVIKMLYTVSDVVVDKSNVTCKLHVPDRQKANFFRQVIMGDIPTVAIDVVNVYTNISPHHDEYLAHRLGLIPLKITSTKNTINLKDVQFELNVHATTVVRNVTTKDLISNAEIVPVDDDILICKLFPGQSIHLKAFVKEGTGKDHAKWSPVSSITFKDRDGAYYFQIETIGMITGETLIKMGLTIFESK